MDGYDEDLDEDFSTLTGSATMLYDSQSKTYDVSCANFMTSMRPLFTNVHLREYLASAAHGPDAAAPPSPLLQLPLLLLLDLLPLLLLMQKQQLLLLFPAAQLPLLPLPLPAAAPNSAAAAPGRLPLLPPAGPAQALIHSPAAAAAASATPQVPESPQLGTARASSPPSLHSIFTLPSESPHTQRTRPADSRRIQGGASMLTGSSQPQHSNSPARRA